MFSWLSTAWKWIVANSKWVLLGGLAAGIVFLIILWGRKNNRIRTLQHQLAVLKAKIKLEKLSVKHDVLVEELANLKEEDAVLQAEIEAIKVELENKLVEDMTLEEVAEKLRELSL